MPRDLPGMYWDEERQRYFPLSSKPAGTGGSAQVARPSAPPAAAETQWATQPKRRRKRKLREPDLESPPVCRDGHTFDNAPGLWPSFNVMRESPSGTSWRRCIHHIQASYLSARAIESDSSGSHGGLPLDLGDIVTATSTRSDDIEDNNIWVGDGSGWLYSVNTQDPDSKWREFFLGTQITSITRSGLTTLVTSLGSPARALITRDQTLGLWLLREFPPNMCDDAWCGHVYGRTVVIGGRRGAVCFLDAEHDQYVRLRCQSDVFSVRFQNEDLMYIGMRNGAIERWDLRQPTNPPNSIVNISEKKGGTGGAPVQHLRLIHQYGLLVETMRGDLEIHDLRYLRGATPLLELEGHVSSYEHKLGFTIDTAEDFLFAGGGDCRLRAWSLRTGRAFHSSTGSLNFLAGSNPFRTTYPRPIRAIEIVPGQENTSLWLGSHTHLHRIQLGPNGILR
ncbi:hypothetical protein BV20DRAFT_1041735 [Pilatotrama ljubarskyi]|nr:hypothetical protein BV20DRAFT_1041735 [Pilatotrama ljubarskyi]